ncbi:MAG: hypothetical protein ABI780_11610 [Ardenticatenales bacterium]
MQARPRNPFTWTFDIAIDEEVVTTLALAWLGSSASFDLDGRRYDLQRAPGFGEFQLVGPSGVLATAFKPNPFVRRYNVEVGRGRYTLEAAAPIARRFVLRAGDDIVGEVAPDAPIARSCRAMWPDDMPLPAQVFLLWLVVLQWRNAARH